MQASALRHRIVEFPRRGPGRQRQGQVAQKLPATPRAPFASDERTRHALFDMKVAKMGRGSWRLAWSRHVLLLAALCACGQSPTFGCPAARQDAKDASEAQDPDASSAAPGMPRQDDAARRGDSEGGADKRADGVRVWRLELDPSGGQGSEGAAEVEVEDDAVYESSKRYLGRSLSATLMSFAREQGDPKLLALLSLLETPAGKRGDTVPEGSKVSGSGRVAENSKEVEVEGERPRFELVFHCIDGYAPKMPLALAMRQRGFLVHRDLDAPEGSRWIPFAHGRSMVNPAPWMVVWQGVAATDLRFKWPYRLTALEIIDRGTSSASAPTHAAYPKDPALVSAYATFEKHCMSCHAVNGVGGQHGPEFNDPKNILQYWREADFRAFAKRPSSYRKGSTMPSNPHLTERDLDAIVAYLRGIDSQRSTR